MGQFGLIMPRAVPHDHLTNTVKDAHDEGKALGPVERVARADPALPFVEVELDPVAVIFDLVEVVPGRGLRAQRGQLGFNEFRASPLTRAARGICHA